MLRKSGKPLVALVAGIVVTIFVAGAACVWSYPWSTTTRVGNEALRISEFIREHFDEVQMISPGPHGYDTVTCEIVRGFGFTHYVLTYERRYPPEIRDGRVVEWKALTTGTTTAYGWPFRCFIARNITFAPRSFSGPHGGVITAVEELLRGSRVMILPLVGNVVILWLAFWLLPGLPRRIRGIYRIAQRRCATCGYPRGPSSTRCSECGALLPSEPAMVASSSRA